MNNLTKKTVGTLFVMLMSAVALHGQTPSSPAGSCEKNVSFAVTAGGQPVAAIPNFVVHALGGAKRPRYPGLCFSQSPDLRAKNYVVVFSTQQESFAGLLPSVLKYVNSTPVSENSSLSAIYGEMWHYTTNQPAAADTTTLDLLRTDTSTALLVRAYNEQGIMVSQVSLKDISGWLHTRDKLLDRVMGDIRADAHSLSPSQAPLRTSLPVYHVNCDVPLKSLTGQEPAATSSPSVPTMPPVLMATLELWSSPTGADVYLDGRLVGKTPSSFTIAPGEYIITMRKLTFGTWQRRVQVIVGKRRIAGYLEQKVITLGSGLH